MKRIAQSKTAAIVGALLLATVGFAQFKQILKVGGVIAVISAFGKDINNGFNKLWNRKDDAKVKTKVVPILSIGSGNAIGAVQVMGPPKQVDRVVAVAQPELRLLGNELRIRALIPISDKDTKDANGLSIVNEVGVSGIVDLKL